MKSVKFVLMLGVSFALVGCFQKYPMPSRSEINGFKTAKQLPDLTSISNNSKSNSILNIGLSDQVEVLRGKLLHHEYSEVEKDLTACFDSSNIYVSTEKRCSSLFSALATTEPGMRASLNSWLDQDENNYIANTLMGGIEAKEAWIIRGGRFSGDTHPLVMQEFQIELQDAISYLTKAIQINPDVPYAYTALIPVYRGLGDSKLKDLYRQAKSKVPQSFTVANSLMEYYSPRWGGSYQKMYSLWAEYRELAEDDPEYLSLWASIETMKARDLYDGVGVEVDREKAYEILNEIETKGYKFKNLYSKLRWKAYKDGDLASAEYYFFQEVALEGEYFSTMAYSNCYCEDGQIALELEMAKKLVERYPTTYKSFLKAGKVYHRLHQYEKSLQMFEVAIQLNPDFPYLKNYLAHAQKRLNKPHIDPMSEENQKDLLTHVYPLWELVSIKPTNKTELALFEAEYELLQKAFREKLDDRKFIIQKWILIAAYYSKRVGYTDYLQPIFFERMEEFVGHDEGQQMIKLFDSLAEEASAEVGGDRS